MQGVAFSVYFINPYIPLSTLTVRLQTIPPTLYAPSCSPCFTLLFSSPPQPKTRVAAALLHSWNFATLHKWMCKCSTNVIQTSYKHHDWLCCCCRHQEYLFILLLYSFLQGSASISSACFGVSTGVSVSMDHLRMFNYPPAEVHRGWLEWLIRLEPMAEDILPAQPC